MNTASVDNPMEVLVSEGQAVNSYDPEGVLPFGQTYYWRVDEVNAAPENTIFEGAVWSFTVEPYSIVVQSILATASSQDPRYPSENTINGSGLDEADLHGTAATTMWLSAAGDPAAWIQYAFDRAYKLDRMLVWNSNQAVESFVGFGVKEVTIEVSTNGTNWTVLENVHQFAQAPGAAGYAANTIVDFNGVTVQFARISVNSGYGPLAQYGLSEVRFFHVPLRAREPNPDSGATDVNLDTVLSFRAGREAAEHDVYLGTDEQAVIDGTAPVAAVSQTSYAPPSLDLGQTYYWKVNEVNMAETPSMWQGDIWNFTTHEFFIVDGFEDYNDYPPDEIWSTWVDGYGVVTNGATVGYPAPNFLAGEHYVETTIVHGGSQSMPFFYDNTGAAVYSEGERTFAVPQDWTKAGVQTLTLWFNGTSGNTGQLYVKLNGSKVVYDGDASNLA